MRIVMFSINPLFPDAVMGGAPKQLQQIAMHLGSLGHEVEILCARPNAAALPFDWSDQVSILPILPFKQPFPQPYAVPAYDIATIIQIVADRLKSADRFYMHDGEFLFPDVYKDIPTVVSLRDNIYPETLIGGFLFQGDQMILISEYSRQYVLNTIGRFCPQLAERIRVIHNGLNWDRFKPVQTDGIVEYLGREFNGRLIVLHPHRPEPSKGIMETIAVVAKLVHEHGLTNVLALAPRWHTAQASADLLEFYHQVEDTIVQHRLSNHFLFHEWIPQSLMPAYYSLGDVTLSLGHFPETFGNSVYESLGCGTPVVVSRVSTHRELLPDHLIEKVDYGDIEDAAERAATILREAKRTTPETMQYLHDHYSTEGQLQAYADVILGAAVLPKLEFEYRELDTTTRFVLAPWCYISEKRGVYHDYFANYRMLPGDVIKLLQNSRRGISHMEAIRVGIEDDLLAELFAQGYLVPGFEQE